jgi:GDP-L-fucose synthase
MSGVLTPGARVYVAGHRGMVGSAIVRRLNTLGHEPIVRTRAELDLTRQQPVEDFFARERPEVVFFAAAKVGGILANSTYPADFIGENLAIQTNVIHSASRSGVKKLVFLGSSCIYPKLAAQPISEGALLTGPLEPTNEWYAVAKIAGIKMVQAYRAQHGFNAISLMPTNLYGPGDNFDLESSHVAAAMIRKFHRAAREGATEVVLWGTGSPRREFLHVDDLANAAVFALEHYDDPAIMNIGSGEDLTIAELAAMVCDISGYRGRIVWDTSKPDGTPRKLLDVSRLHALGWKHRIDLRSGLESAYRWFVENAPEAR